MSHFMGMPAWQKYNQTYGYLPATKQTDNLPLHIWWPYYSQALYILSQTFQAPDKEDIRALNTFVYCLFRLVPNVQFRGLFEDFVAMKPYVIKMIQTLAPNVFLSYSHLEYKLKHKPSDFFMESMQNKDNEALLIWVYLLNVFVAAIQQKINEQRVSNGLPAEPSIYLPNLNEIRVLYNKETLKIYDWSHPMWFILHTTSLYAPQPIEESFVLYANMVRCLTKLLPCPKCRDHLAQNLQHLDFVGCQKTPENLFKCSWQLHNIVNKSTQKPLPSLQQAMSWYTF